MNKTLIYDSTLSVPQEINSLLGVSSFADIYYRKRLLNRWMADIARQAGMQFLDLGDKNAHGAIQRLAVAPGSQQMVVYVPACMAFACKEADAVQFLTKLCLTQNNIQVNGAKETASTSRLPRIAVMLNELARSYLQSAEAGEEFSSFYENISERFQIVPDDVGIIDLRDPLHFTDYLTSNFDVRFFNSVQTVNDFVVMKRSSDAKKLHREHEYYQLLPPELKMFFVQPYDFQEERDGGSYKMERLFMPDMALQWIHGSISQLDFQRFLEKTFFFLASRPTKQVPAAVANATRFESYKTKLLSRIDQLKARPEYTKISQCIEATVGDIDSLVERYLALLDRSRALAVESELCIGHGDLCFSNILYSKITGLMRFIDPKGAETEEDLYVNPTYDIAKLSHSICGNYDFINYGLYRLEIDRNLKAKLIIDPQPPSWATTMFLEKLRVNALDPKTVRLYEVCLFLSMLPLHIDSPNKVVALVVNAANILDEIEPHF